MKENQIHYGKKFYKDIDTGYWISCSCPKIRAHRWVWLCIHKVIPKGYHIHHINEDKSDNRIENLELIEGSRHLSHHMQDPKRKERARLMAEKYRPLTKIWHKSNEGKAWHKLHALKNKFGNWDPSFYKCDICGKEYQSKSKSRNRFCSNNCKSAWRRKSGLDNVERICPICLKSFKVNKYAKTVTCSRKCVEEKKRRK